MRKLALTVLVASWLCIGGAGSSRADDRAGTTTADNTADNNKIKAQAHYSAGLRAYNVGEFDQAIKEWKSAYQFLGAPDFLFNIAQAYRQKRDYEEAVFFYNAFLRGKPDAANVAEVTSLRDEMAAMLENQKKNEQMAPEPKELLGPNGERNEIEPGADGTPSSASTASGAQSSTTAVPTGSSGVDSGVSPTSAGRGMRTVGMISGGAGVLFFATGIAFSLSASSKEADLETAAARYGCQAIVIAVDARRRPDGSYEVYSHGGRTPEGLDAIAWCQQVAARGAGEIMLTSMDRDGTKKGYELALTRAVVDAISIPVIASGGVGSLDDLADGLLLGGADAVLAASIFHFGHHTIGEAKAHLASRGVPVRLPFAPE